ncbi:hypothetical protein [Corynebacterium sp. A21]|uniref:hypothetical protein n=1 Tax=Corynebacterium sp. A21 TaxID=3457318 RepID=UPI003FD02F21
MSEQRMSLSRARELVHPGALHDQWEPYEAARTIAATGDVLDKIKAERESLEDDCAMMRNCEDLEEGIMDGLEQAARMLAEVLGEEP